MKKSSPLQQDDDLMAKRHKVGSKKQKLSKREIALKRAKQHFGDIKSPKKCSSEEEK